MKKENGKRINTLYKIMHQYEKENHGSGKK